MATRSMTIQEKLVYAKALGTAELIEQIHKGETELENLLKEETQLRTANAGYIATRGIDCEAVKRITAEISTAVPAGEDGKKMTVAAREDWLQKQRTDNPQLIEAIQKQMMAATVLEDISIKLEMSRRRLSNLTSILSLRTSQLAFLASDIKFSIAEEEAK